MVKIPAKSPKASILTKKVWGVVRRGEVGGAHEVHN